MKKVKIDFINVLVILNVVDDVIDFRNHTLYKKYPFLKYCTITNCNGLTTYNLDEQHTIWITLEKGFSLPDLVHEISHAVTALFDYFGFNDNELRAYLMDYLFEQLTKTHKK